MSQQTLTYEKPQHSTFMMPRTANPSPLGHCLWIATFSLPSCPAWHVLSYTLKLMSPQVIAWVARQENVTMHNPCAKSTLYWFKCEMGLSSPSKVSFKIICLCITVLCRFTTCIEQLNSSFLKHISLLSLLYPQLTSSVNCQSFWGAPGHNECIPTQSILVL